MPCSRPTRWGDGPSHRQGHAGRAGAADRLAVDGERVHHFGGDAVLFGAFRPPQRVMDDGAVAVLQAGSTPPAPVVCSSRKRLIAAHGRFIAPRGDKPWLPRLRPAEFVQAVIVDAEVMCDLMDDGDRHLVDHLVLGLADVQQGLSVDRDRVG